MTKYTSWNILHRSDALRKPEGFMTLKDRLLIIGYLGRSVTDVGLSYPELTDPSRRRPRN